MSAKPISKRGADAFVGADLVARARAEGLNLSSIAEAAVAAVLARRQRERWNADIAAACAAHERYLEQYGSFAEILREQDPAGGAG